MFTVGKLNPGAKQLRIARIDDRKLDEALAGGYSGDIFHIHSLCFKQIHLLSCAEQKLHLRHFFKLRLGPAKLS